MPTVIPASGTTVRPSTGKIPNPKSTPRHTAAEDAKAASAITVIPGASGARRPTMTAANTTIPAAHTHDHATGWSGSSTSTSAHPTTSSCTSARTAATMIGRSSSSRNHADTATASTTRPPAAASPHHPTDALMSARMTPEVDET